MVALDVETLDAVTQASAATAAPALYDDIAENCVLDFAFGDAGQVAAAFASAAHVQKLSMRNSRIVVAAMEPRSAIGEYADGRFTLHVGCQGVFGLQQEHLVFQQIAGIIATQRQFGKNRQIGLFAKVCRKK